MTSQDALLNILEEKAGILQKTQINLKKCPKQRLTKGYIESRLTSIDEYWSSFKNIHEELVKLTPREKRSDISYFVNEDFFVYEDLYLNMRADLKDMLYTLSSIKTELTQQGTVSKSGHSDSSHLQVKLPKIQLPTFCGNYEEWPAFQDLFISLVHNNTVLSNVQKLHYLKTSVGGEAEALLKHIQITEINYEQAWTTLRDRYGNKRLIVNSLIKRLINQRKVIAPTANQIKFLLDTTMECLNSLNNQQINTDSWDPIIIFLITQKLDPESHKDWEQHSYKENSNDIPTWPDLRRFLESKFRTLELIAPSSSTRDRSIRERVFHVSAPSTNPKSCVMCKEDHTICHCKEFAKMQPTERSEFVQKNNLCYNCLLPGHSVIKCRVPMSCRVCNKRHHSLLHQHKTKTPTDVQTHHSNLEQHEDNIEVSTHYATKKSTALLATAIVPVKDRYGRITTLRALIDQGSQASFITKRAAQLLRLKGSIVRGTITGVGSTRTSINRVVQLEVLSCCDNQFKLNINAYVMTSQLTKHLPTQTIEEHAWPHIQGLFLADPKFNQSSRIDMLLGVEVCAEILIGDIIRGPPGSPCALNTKLGWILFGNIAQHIASEEFLVTHHHVDVENMLKKMWEIETSDKNEYTKEEKLCENLYNSTHYRTKEGRYIVQLPKKTETLLSTEGDTRNIAMKRLNMLEKRFTKDLKLKNEYVKVINEYIEKNHMEEVPNNEINKPSVYLPHHPVIREDKETTKVRVVFDASCKGTNNVSINDELLVGPQLQEDMRNIIIRWRLKRICFVADIQQMYRQILVTQKDADFQRLLWRVNSDEPVKDYRLLRVTFGTSCAPYLAVKTLHQVADDEGDSSPEAANIIKHDFFMDDLMSGRDTVEDAINIAKEIKHILEKGGFKLQKWASNSAKFLNEFEQSERSSHVNINIKVDGTIRALGLVWNMGNDQFKYDFQLPLGPETITKRTILAEIQRLFDPLGWLAPAIIPAKIIIQKLWLNGTAWDEEVLPETKKEWLNIRNSYNNLKNTYLPRWLNTSQNLVDGVSVHGFCDASERAYGAVAYIRVQNEDGKYETGIIAAKGRVAPTKPLSLPRLELCSAYLLSTLLKQIEEATRISRNQIFAWTDSTVVLSWLRGDPTRWQTFVRNRVVNILENIGNNWFHVRSVDNPADLVSRGMLLQELNNCQIWWKGPNWLREKYINYSLPENLSTHIERKIDKINVQTNVTINTKENEEKKDLSEYFERFDSLSELLRIITYSKRFINTLKNLNNNETPLPISKEELDEALLCCIQIVQKKIFNEEIKRLSKNKKLKKGHIQSLNPYLDANNILRVGGRLKHANINEDQKHPIILDNKNSLTKLIVAQAHTATLHGGVQLMLNYIRSKYWIIKAKNLVKNYIHNCLICCRHNATARSQLMGDLPKERVNPARAFLYSGVDFSGPYQTLMSKGRGLKTFKGYIAIFICLATKAVHLEYVGDMSSEAFIGAFKRFVSRRGRCSDMWSDQGRNFIGANQELIKAWKESKLEFSGQILEKLAVEGVKWHFIPAYSPNFGGLWEAGVKSIKHHLKRILTTNLTFEEMCTVLCEIEACLNSRPLCPIDDTDVENMNPLTPGHFLIGEAPINLLSPSLRDAKISLLSRWQYIKKLVEDFWHRWQQEYLSRLQQRPKWLRKERELDIGQIVVIKTDNLPPGKWMLGRILDKHPGADRVTRVYSVKSGRNVVKRSITKLCPLPVNVNTDS